MSEFKFHELDATIRQVRCTAPAGRRCEALRLIADRRITPVSVGLAILTHTGELEPFNPPRTLVATFDDAGCPIWEMC